MEHVTDAMLPYAPAIARQLEAEGIWCAHCSDFPFVRPFSRDRDALISALRQSGWKQDNLLLLEFEDQLGNWVEVAFVTDQGVDLETAAWAHFRNRHPSLS